MFHASHDDSIKSVSSRRIEVITGPVLRRRWTAEEKTRIVAESFAGQMSALAVARRHGVAGGVLYAWRKQARDGVLAIAPIPERFVPLEIDDGRSGEAQPAPMIEVVAGDVTIRLATSTDEETLRRVIRAVRAA
jgi:transposase